MGILADFREVLKELKHKKRGEATINLCPKCGSPRISLSSGFDTYPRMYGITPRRYVCAECGYKGPIVMEQTKKEETG
jgi:C4-type Zn-finger protein